MKRTIELEVLIITWSDYNKEYEQILWLDSKEDIYDRFWVSALKRDMEWRFIIYELDDLIANEYGDYNWVKYEYKTIEVEL